jgi:hypothetical protein
MQKTHILVAGARIVGLMATVGLPATSLAG